MVKQLNWALRAREPIGFKGVSEVTAKWKPAGYEVPFDGGQAVIAHFEGRIVAIAWQQMGDVERHLIFTKIQIFAENRNNPAENLRSLMAISYLPSAGCFPSNLCFSAATTSKSAGSQLTVSISSYGSHLAASCSFRIISPLSTWHI